MNTNDRLLMEMITSDMAEKGIASFHLSDETAENPEKVKVGANEAVYVCYLSTKQADPYSIELVSGTTVTRYTPSNTRVYYRGKVEGSATYYDYIESSLITRHWSDIKITYTGSKDTGFFLRFVRVKFTGNEKS